MSSFEVITPGVLSLLQDNGRFGQSALGLTTGGAMDAPSARWANRLLGNNSNATLIECSVGGLQLRADCSSYIAVTGAELPLSINGKAAERYVLGDWYTQSSYLKVSASQWQLYFNALTDDSPAALNHQE